MKIVPEGVDISKHYVPISVVFTGGATILATVVTVVWQIGALKTEMIERMNSIELSVVKLETKLEMHMDPELLSSRYMNSTAMILDRGLTSKE